MREKKKSIFSIPQLMSFLLMFNEQKKSKDPPFIWSLFAKLQMQSRKLGKSLETKLIIFAEFSTNGGGVPHWDLM